MTSASWTRLLATASLALWLTPGALAADEAGLDPADVKLAVISRIYKQIGRSYTQVYIVQADGSGLRALTDTPTEKGFVAASPDGRRLAFLEGQGERRYAVTVVAVDSGKVLGRVPFGNWQRPRWGSDGRLYGAGKPKLWIDYETGEAREAESPPDDPILEHVDIDPQGHVCPSPAGTYRVEFIPTDPKPDRYAPFREPERIVIHGPGGEVKLPQHNGAGASSHTWSADGSLLLIRAGGAGNVYYPATFILDPAAATITEVGEDFDDVGFVGGTRYLLSIVGHGTTTKYLHELDPPRTIAVWGNDLCWVDRQTGQRHVVISETSKTVGYAVLSIGD